MSFWPLKLFFIFLKNEIKKKRKKEENQALGQNGVAGPPHFGEGGCWSYP
jgi:hypothetical protein